MADIFELFKMIEKKDSTPTSSNITHIVVGLGNPGEKYSRTRHNAGFLCMDYLSQKYALPKFKLRFKSTCAEGTVNGHRVLFMKPETFMNNSGEAVKEAAAFYKIPTQNIIVMSDDINLAPGVLRIRQNGSDGGQKGLRSIIEHMGSDNIPRLRVGVGAKPSPEYDLCDWVLGEIPKANQEEMFDAFERISEAIPLILDGKINDAINKYNGKPKEKTENGEKE